MRQYGFFTTFPRTVTYGKPERTFARSASFCFPTGLRLNELTRVLCHRVGAWFWMLNDRSNGHHLWKLLGDYEPR